MAQYLQDIWRCRFFWLSLVRIDLRTRYRRSFLGMGWSLLQPIAMTIILCTMFHKILHINIPDYAPYLLAGLACWNYMFSSMLQGCQCFFQGEPYIRQHPAPLAIYPLRTALGAGIHFLMALIVVVCLGWYFKGNISIPALLSYIPTACLLLMFAWSLAVLGGFANVYFQDTQHLAEVGFQLIFYATPIIYTEDILQQHNMAWLLNYNPFVPFLRLIREPVMHGQPPSLAVFGAALAVVLVAASAASLTLARSQRTLIFHL
jgi:ABC-type polysaccharide/polyol phosphate export permease